MAYRRADAYEEAIACLDEALTALVNGDADGCIRSADLLLALSSRGLAWLAVNAYECPPKEMAQALTLAKQIGRVRLAWDCHQALARVAAALGDAKCEQDQRASTDLAVHKPGLTIVVPERAGVFEAGLGNDSHRY